MMTTTHSARGGASFKPPQSHISQAFRLTETKVPRQYVRVPKDQEELLNRPDAWSTKGFANVPAEVLQSLKDFHSRKSRASSQPISSTGLPDRDDGLKDGLPQDGDLSGQASDDDESLTSWSTSPARPARTSPGARELPTSSQSRPPDSPELPRPVAKAIPRILDVNCFPSSSIGSEGEMEVEPPRAITEMAHNIVKAVQASQPQPTPPSAQAQVVPCTYNPQSSPVKPAELPEYPSKRRRHKPLPYSSSQLSLDTPVQPDAPGLEPLSRSLTTGPSAQLSSSYVGTANINRYQSAQAAQSPTKRKRSMIGSSQGDADNHNQGAQARSSNSEKLPPNGPASQVPFTAFTLQYPEYKGSLGDFVKAIICIQDLQKNRALPQFLYDDFIRVFSDDYLEYIGQLDDTSRPLTASQWYNENVQRPLYTKGVITRSTLQNAVESYPDEFRSVRRSLGGNRRSVEQPMADLMVTCGDEPSQAMDAAEDCEDFPLPSAVRSPSLSIRQSRAFHTISSYAADESPEITRTGQEQHDIQQVQLHPVRPEEVSPEIMSQVIFEISHGSSDGPSSPHQQRQFITTTQTPAKHAKAESIPETAVRPKLPHPVSPGLAKPSSMQKSRAERLIYEDPVSRSVRFTKFLKQRQERLQSSAPPNSNAS